jgi:hypothetical protein
MFERRISVDDVRQVLEAGDVIEDYPEDVPYPSRLMLGRVRNRPIHVVAADNQMNQEVIVITAYEPDRTQWQPDFRRRKA